MEKLLKLTNKTVELNKINFLGFSSSKNWMGYFEFRKDGKNDRITACNHALRLVYSYFINKSFFTVSALAYTKNTILSKDIGFLFLKAKKYNLIQKLSSDIDGYLIGDHDLLAHNISISFNQRAFIILSKLVMLSDDVIGDACFFILPDLGLAIYPHEDIGYGCISLSDDCNNAIEFLNFCSKDEGFEVVFSEKINQLAISKTMFKES
jgi:hypothetical protein